MSQQKEIWTIGHSTRTQEEFLEMLRNFRVELLVDVRRYPGSRKYPHFAKEQMQLWIPENNIEYLHLEDLGGRRKVNKDTKNMAWRLISFRGYADHMETPEFHKAAQQLQELALLKRTAYMCSEAVWWSCHRSLISDYLKVRGWKVNHIMALDKAPEHPYTKPANIVDGKLNYHEQSSRE